MNAAEQPTSITCPQCGATSYNPTDIDTGYCGRCHNYTAMPTNDYEIVEQILVAAMLDCLRFCDEDGANLPEMIAGALTIIARVHGSERLIEHRPGSWEAQHIVALDMSSLYAP